MTRQIIVTPTHLFQYATQPLWIWYDLFGDASRKEPISDFAMKLLEEVSWSDYYLPGHSTCLL